MPFSHSQVLCLWMKKVFTKSLSMQWKIWKRKNGSYGFSHGKSSLFIQRLNFNSFTLLTFLGFVQPLSETMCVLVDKQWTGECRVQRSCSSRPDRPLRSQVGCEVHDCTLNQNTCHVDLMDKLGREKVASKPRNHYLMLLPIFKEMLKYSTPKYMKIEETIHQH